MSEFMKIGGKYTDGQGGEIAKGISVDADGQLKVVAVRHNEVQIVDVITNLEKRDSANVAITGTNAIDLSEWTSCCILVTNQLDVDDVNIQFYTQKTASGTSYLKYSDGSNVKLVLPKISVGAYIITPDDFPILNYLRYFKGILNFPTAPTSGYITISLMLKR